ncbi:hypothetical protein C1646_773195 [Rhizophagus diaphanus]|nr:hypothetical protein C1646_773195 [Rhizophagus diaphanus] [Rhizophagus sp. MUCL 43196]
MESVNNEHGLLATNKPCGSIKELHSTLDYQESDIIPVQKVCRTTGCDLWCPAPVYDKDGLWEFTKVPQIQNKCLALYPLMIDLILQKIYKKEHLI